ncbi:MAG: hypothetical protein CM1200mP20_16420 [Pseudomonadota bacterium]|nr:MAG: hypothetical protein CM1200mP20_16420 [Pseudomonadota bacterium]
MTQPGERGEKTDETWRNELTPEQYGICRLKGTEPPFSGQYNDCKTPGTYTCTCCGSALFQSTEKFDSGSGWPSFWQAVAEDAVRLESDQATVWYAWKFSAAGVMPIWDTFSQMDRRRPSSGLLHQLDLTKVTTGLTILDLNWRACGSREYPSSSPITGIAVRSFGL